jgi:hypothetical protein
MPTWTSTGAVEMMGFGVDAGHHQRREQRREHPDGTAL